MSEGIPPVPPSVPPKPVDPKKEEKGPVVVDANSWGASGASPLEAAATFSDDLKKEVKDVAGKVGKALKKGKIGQKALPGAEPELELPAPDAELALEAPPAPKGTYAGADGDFPVELGKTEIGPDGQEYTHVTSAEFGLDGFVPTSSITKAPEANKPKAVPAGPMISGADGLISLESLKNPEKKDFLKPAEIKRIWKEELKNAVGKVAITQEGLSTPEGLKPPTFEEFRNEMAAQKREDALGVYASLQDADSKYEDAFKGFYYKNNFVGRIFKRMRPLGAASMEINDARMERDQLRLAANEKLADAARARWEAQGKSPEWIDKAFARYQNWYLLRDIITPGAERETQMRAEALGEKVPDQLEKGMAWIKQSNENINTWIEGKLGEKNKKFAPILRAVGGAVVISGGAAFVGGFATVGVMAALGLASFSVYRALAATGAGFVAAEIVGSGYKKLIGEKAQAKAKIENVDLKEELKRLTQSKELTLELLQTIDRKRVQLQSRASDETLMQKTALLKTLVGLGVGMSTAMAITQWDNMSKIANAVESVGGGADRVPAGTSGMDSAPTGPSGGGTPDGAGVASPEGAAPPTAGAESAAPSSPDQAPAAAAGAESTPSPVEAAPEPRSLEISGNINNADRLVGHFGLELQEAYGTPSEAPPAVQRLFELLRTDDTASLLAGEDKATLALGLQTADGSAIMQPGDTISLNADNQIVLERPGAPELRTVLIDANGELATSHNFPMDAGPDVVPAAPEVPAQPAAAAVEAPVQPESPVASAPAPEAPEAPVASETPSQPEAPQPPGQADVVPQQPSYIPEAPATPEPPPPPPSPVTFDSAPEAPAAPEAPPAPPVAPEAPVAPEVTPGTEVNAYGLEVDSRVVGLYADASDNLIVHGGTLTERMQLAQEIISRDHTAVVFLDSTLPDPITGLDVAHITRAFWDPNLNQIQMPNEAMDPSLQTYTLPTADDLARRVDMPQ